MPRNISITDNGNGSITLTDNDGASKFIEQKGNLSIYQNVSGATDQLSIRRNSTNETLIKSFNAGDVLVPSEANNDDLIAAITPFFFRELSGGGGGGLTPGAYYVSPDGDDTTGTGSADSPFATIQKGITEASGATPSTVIVLAGVYDESFVLADEVDIICVGQVAILNFTSGGTIMTSAGSGACKIQFLGTGGIYSTVTNQSVLELSGSFALEIIGGELRAESANDVMMITTGDTSELTLNDTTVFNNSTNGASGCILIESDSSFAAHNVEFRQDVSNTLASPVRLDTTQKVLFDNVTIACGTGGFINSVASSGAADLYVYSGRATRSLGAFITQRVSSMTVSTFVT